KNLLLAMGSRCGPSSRIPICSRVQPHRHPRKGATGKIMGLLDGKAAIITGSARGIGRATAELFVSEGAKVLINDIDGHVAEQASSEIQGETAVHAGDLTTEGACDELVAKAQEAFGSVDILVNNAGYTWDGV